MRRLGVKQFQEELADEEMGAAVDEACSCFKCADGTLVALRWLPERRLLWIVAAEGQGLGWIRELKPWILASGARLVGFMSRLENAAVTSLALYSGARAVGVDRGSLVYLVRTASRRWKRG